MEDERFGNDQGAISEWDAFLADKRHLRYEDTDSNWNHLFDFRKQHGLYFSSESLHLAFATLLDTLELPPLVPATPPPTPTAPDPRAPQAFRNGRPIAWTNPRSL